MTRAEMAKRREAEREVKAYRRAAIARDVEEGHSLRAVAEHWGITPQRVGQILKRVKRDAQRERCARDEHGDVTETEYGVWEAGIMIVRYGAVCNDCGKVIE